MAYHQQIEGTNVQVGDIITVTGEAGSMIFSNVRVYYIDPDTIAVVGMDNEAERDAFEPLDSYWKFYLIERPKKPLPTAIGSVVEADGQTWVLCDPEDSTSWRSTPHGFWASGEELQEYDFTVV